MVPLFEEREGEGGGHNIALPPQNFQNETSSTITYALHEYRRGRSYNNCLIIRHQTFDAGRKKPKLEKIRKENARVGLSVANSGFGKLHLKFDREAEREWTTASISTDHTHCEVIA